ncbi:acylneuraminate cytidylyltransferase [bacterium]|nr:MAG: acylneuraminate cytidylyltransferase [bacterium]
MRSVAIIQARTGSMRLPGKVLKRLCGLTVLEHVVRRVRACEDLDAVVVATSEAPNDDPVSDMAQRCGAGVFRGSEDDVLDRFHGAAREARADVIVRITADCPLLDPQVLGQVYRRFRESDGVDYVSNTLERTYPRGLDVEVMSAVALERAHAEARKPYEREHVTPFIYGHPELFTLANVAWDRGDFAFHRWTLDTSEDFAFITAVYEALYREGAIFGAPDVLALLDRRPELVGINSAVRQKALDE